MGEDYGSAVPRSGGSGPLPLVVATIFREQGSTGIHTHVRQLSRYVERSGGSVTVVTPFSWCRPLTYPVFGVRLALVRASQPAGVVWYRHWHEVFLRKALRRRLAQLDECIVYAQGPVEAAAALRARRGPHQRVVLAVHFRASMADEHAEPGRELRRNGLVFRSIRRSEQAVIPRVDGLVYVSEWARDALLSWLPQAASVPSTVTGNFVTPMTYENREEPTRDLVSTGKLEDRKNHRFLLDVLAEAGRAGRRLTLDVFGDGPLWNDLHARCRELGLQEQVRFLGVRSDVREQLPNYRVYAHAALAETSSLAIIEAMAAGLPILAGPIGPLPELFDDGVEGRYWPLDDPARAAAILVDLLADQEAMGKASRAARERFARDFDANVVGARLWSFLQEAGSRRG